MSAAIFDLFGADSCISVDNIAVRKPHDESWIAGAPAHEHGDTMAQIACRQKKTVFRWVLDRIIYPTIAPVNQFHEAIVF